MNDMRYSRLRRAMFALLMLVSFLSSFTAAYAATSYTLTYASDTTITEFATCRLVSNNNEFQKSLFVGTKTATEWQSFYEGPPNGVSAVSCTIGSGNVMSTGLSFWGGVGDGAETYTAAPTPLPVTGGWKTAVWKKIASGYYTSCGIMNDDTIRCWGWNNYSTVGDATNTNKEFPTALGGGFAATTWSDISSGGQTTCAIRKTDSYIYCWGYNIYGQVGDNTASTRNIPTALTGAFGTTAWKAVSVGAEYACAIRTSDSRIYCWGRDDFGMLGNGVGDSSTRGVGSTPTALSGTFGTTAWKALSAGSYHACAIRTSDSYIYCWGRNYIGQIGNGTTVTDEDGGQPIPVALTGAFGTTAWKDVSAGGNHTCAIRTSDNAVYCWGHGGNGRIGNGAAASVSTPTALVSPYNTTAWTMVSSGVNNTCAIRTSDSRLYCWGYGVFGTMGSGLYTSTNSTPTDLTDQDGWSASAWKDVNSGNNFVCGLKTDGTAACWGVGAYGQLSNGIFTRTIPTGLTDEDGSASTVWSIVAGGERHACALRASDKVMFCWGENNYGQLGATSASGSFKPIPLTTSSGYNTTAWKQVSPGASFTCALRNSDSAAFCWGYDGDGRLGDGITTNRGVPGTLEATFASTAWESLAESTGSGHMCGIRASDYRMYCWGDNSYCQLGVGTADLFLSTPTALGGGFNTTQWKAVTVSNRNTCALRRADSRMYCWGDGSGYGNATSDTSDKNIPTAITSTGGWDAVAWSKVSVGYLYGCATRTSDSYLFCWGTNTYGQLGDGTTTSKSVPTALSGTFGTSAWKGITTTTTGWTCGIKTSDSRIYCWGDNRYGQFGAGNTTSSLTPVGLTATNSWSTTTFSTISSGIANLYAIRQ